VVICRRRPAGSSECVGGCGGRAARLRRWMLVARAVFFSELPGPAEMVFKELARPANISPSPSFLTHCSSLRCFSSAAAAQLSTPTLTPTIQYRWLAAWVRLSRYRAQPTATDDQFEEDDDYSQRSWATSADPSGQLPLIPVGNFRRS